MEDKTTTPPEPLIRQYRQVELMQDVRIVKFHSASSGHCLLHLLQLQQKKESHCHQIESISISYNENLFDQQLIPYGNPPVVINIHSFLLGFLGESNHHSKITMGAITRQLAHQQQPAGPSEARTDKTITNVPSDVNRRNQTRRFRRISRFTELSKKIKEMLKISIDIRKNDLF